MGGQVAGCAGIVAAALRQLFDAVEPHQEASGEVHWGRTMKRTLQLHLEIAKIALKGWVPGDQDDLTFPFEKGKLKGTVCLNLDRQGLDYDDLDFDGLDADGKESFRPVGPAVCSRVVIRVEGRSADHVTEEEFAEVAQQLTDEYLNRMLSYVRAELQQYWVNLTPIAKRKANDFLRHARAKWIDELGESTKAYRAVGIGIRPLIPGSDNFYDHCVELDEIKWQDIRAYIRHKEDNYTLSKTLLANAKQHFERGQYRVAVVEALSALEVALFPFVKERCERRGISRTKLKDVDDKLTMSVHLKVLLSLVLDKDELDDWLNRRMPGAPEGNGRKGEDMIGACIHLNKFRNKIVHEGRMPEAHDIERIKQGIAAAEGLLDFIRAVAT